MTDLIKWNNRIEEHKLKKKKKRRREQPRQPIASMYIHDRTNSLTTTYTSNSSRTARRAIMSTPHR